MKISQISENTKLRLAVLYNLLNLSTEFDGNTNRICSIMDEIEEYLQTEKPIWKMDFEIVVNGSVVFKVHNNGILVN